MFSNHYLMLRFFLYPFKSEYIVTSLLTLESTRHISMMYI